MKYKPEDYIECDMYGGDFDYEVEHQEIKLVKCRKPHQCTGGCETEIKAGEIARVETGFMDGIPRRCYLCLPCIESWLDEINGEEDSNEPADTAIDIDEEAN